MNKKFFVITQCRLSSTRLPNKIILKFGNKTFLDFFIERIKKIKAEKIICSVAKEKNNYKIIDILKKHNIEYYVGSKNNLFNRDNNSIRM